LLNQKGEVKLADFGVSGQLDDAVHKHSFVGTLTYMSPQRIQAQNYSFDSDIWSLGLTLMECATGEFPYEFSQSRGAAADGTAGRGSESAAKASKPSRKPKGGLTFFDVIFCVMETPAPQLPENEFSPAFRDFVAKWYAFKPVWFVI